MWCMSEQEANPADFGGCSEFSVSNAKVYAALSPDGAKRRHVLSLFALEMIVLPRQARDRHKKS
jgi:hypothetical protein|eukprot:COSAG06_NODE_2416_length_6912_cov_11.801409_3_plen_64_part_00